MFNVTTAAEVLILHEKERLKLYKCPAGYWTIGVGRNLEANGITEDESRYLLANDIDRVYEELSMSLAWWHSLDDVRALVLFDMCFNMGLPTLLTFKKFLKALRAGDYEKAALEMEDSEWYDQVGTRSKRLAKWMRTGVRP
jgi:lysozyme